MTSITFEQASKHLCSYGTAVHCEVFRNYRKWHDENDRKQFFFDRGCVIVTEEYDYNDRHWILYNVHQCAPDAAIEEAAEACRQECLNKADAYENPRTWVCQFYVSNGELTEEKNRFYGWRNYARQGYHVQRDPRVRALTEEDVPMIKAACDPYLDYDTDFGMQLAKAFFELDYSWLKDFMAPFGLYGIFDGGTLCGITDATFDRDLNLAWLLDIYVLPPYRGKGYGKALVEAALADHPDVKWHYQAARDNHPSIALAKSLGFTLEGAGLFIL